MVQLRMMTPKDPAAVALGRKGGHARAKNMSKEERSDAARKAVEARWSKLKALVDDITERSKKLEKRAARRAAQARGAKTRTLADDITGRIKKLEKTAKAKRKEK